MPRCLVNYHGAPSPKPAQMAIPYPRKLWRRVLARRCSQYTSHKNCRASTSRPDVTAVAKLVFGFGEFLPGAGEGEKWICSTGPRRQPDRLASAASNPKIEEDGLTDEKRLDLTPDQEESCNRKETTFNVNVGLINAPPSRSTRFEIGGGGGPCHPNTDDDLMMDHEMMTWT